MLATAVQAQGVAGRVLPAPGESQLPSEVTVTLEFPLESFEETSTVNPEGKFFFSVSAGTSVEAYLTVRSPGYQSKRIHIDGFDRFPSNLLISLGPRLPSDSASSSPGSVVDARSLSIPGKARKEFERASEESQKGHTEKALEHLDKAIKAYPDFTGAYAAKGVNLMKLRRLEEAEESFRKALEIDSQSFAANKNLGYLYLITKREEQAIPFLEQATESAPADATAQGFLGEALYQAGRMEEAVSPLERAVELSPDFFRASYRLGYVLLELKRYEESLASFRKFLDTNKGMDETQVRDLVGQLETALSSSQPQP